MTTKHELFDIVDDLECFLMGIEHEVASSLASKGEEHEDLLKAILSGVRNKLQDIEVWIPEKQVA
jgi:hypothetical protein